MTTHLEPGRPLAERLRPARLQDVVGQRHLVGAGGPLAQAMQEGTISSMILWGPPGTGKTTLARLLAQATDAEFIALSAVQAGVKEVREVIQVAESNRRLQRATIVFLDEIHRFNKAQQDALLPHVESGLFTLIGATTENPSFEVNAALLSRLRVHVLEPLSQQDLHTLLERALEEPPTEPQAESATPSSASPPSTAKTLHLTQEVKDWLVNFADGDARRLLNLVEAMRAANPGATELDLAQLKRTLGAALRLFDKSGEQFYDTISALHKSVRGSDPDAALYWFTRMLDGGADPRYLARRMVRMAVEDIGLADPRALRLTLDAAETYERLGSPEGELALAEAVLYLAATAKSNAVYNAYKAARRFVREDGQSRRVPLHLRNAPTRLMRELDYGKGYRYAHDETDAFAAGENYWPDDLPEQPFYTPTDRGLESRIRQRLEELKQRNAEAREKANKAR